MNKIINGKKEGNWLIFKQDNTLHESFYKDGRKNGFSRVIGGNQYGYSIYIIEQYFQNNRIFGERVAMFLMDAKNSISD